LALADSWPGQCFPTRSKDDAFPTDPHRTRIKISDCLIGGQATTWPHRFRTDARKNIAHDSGVDRD